MLDKIIDLTRSCAKAKKICVFFAVFALTMTVLGGVFNNGTGVDAPATEAMTAADPVSRTTPTEPAVQAEAPASHERDHVPVPLTQYAGFKEGEILKTDKTSEPAEIPVKHMDVQTVPAGEKEPDGHAAEQTEALNENTASKPDGFVYIESIPMQYELQKFTYQKCVERGLEYELVLAIMWRESRFNPNAVNLNANGTQDNGIMQINDVNRGWLYEHYGISDLMDPYQNINAGTAMLSSFAGKYGTHGAMMAYQYGEGGMNRRIGEGQTTSTEIETAYRQRDYYRQLA